VGLHRPPGRVRGRKYKGVGAFGAGIALVLVSDSGWPWKYAYIDREGGTVVKKSASEYAHPLVDGRAPKEV
jgi:hypothetical protein